MATAKVEQNAAGDYALGIDVGGAFVPFAVITAARVAHQVERHEDLTAKAEAGDKNAQEVLSEGFAAPNASWTDDEPKGKGK